MVDETAKEGDKEESSSDDSADGGIDYENEEF